LTLTDLQLGGIVRPNDGKCHMDSKGEYTHSTILDYPSVAQINAKVKEKSINMIFAVTAEQTNIYNRLAKTIQGATCGELSANSSNVVELVKDEYQVISQKQYLVFYPHNMPRRDFTHFSYSLTLKR
jgi:protocadherin alpha